MCRLSTVLFFIITFVPANGAFGGEWKLIFEQLSGHEKSYRIVVSSDGSKSAFTKDAKSKDFTQLSIAVIDDAGLQQLQQLWFSLNAAFVRAELTKKFAMDSDIRYRVMYECNGVEMEIRWLAGQIGSDETVSQAYLSILKVVNGGNKLDFELKADPFLKLRPK
jgi:hypothetical protein